MIAHKQIGMHSYPFAFCIEIESSGYDFAVHLTSEYVCPLHNGERAVIDGFLIGYFVAGAHRCKIGL